MSQAHNDRDRETVAIRQLEKEFKSTKCCLKQSEIPHDLGLHIWQRFQLTSVTYRIETLHQN